MAKSLYIPQTVSVPMPLYKSMQGRYFVGYADHLDFNGPGVSAWAGLYNPLDSGVILHVNVWTVTSLYGVFRAEVWFNTRMPGTPSISDLVTTSNFVIHPQARPMVQLLQAENVTGSPAGGVKAFVRRGQAENTITAEEEGKFIFPPGDSFSIFLSNPETLEEQASGRIAYGWWEEPMDKKKH